MIRETQDLIEKIDLIEQSEDPDERERLRMTLSDAERAEWLSVCLLAVEKNDEEWLRTYCDIEENILPWPLDLINRGEPNPPCVVRRVNVARSIAGCALTALRFKHLVPNVDDSSLLDKLVATLCRAVINWQPETARQTIERATAEKIRAAIVASEHADLISGRAHRVALRVIQQAHPEWEIAPVTDLISYFLQLRDDSWERLVSVTVLLDSGDRGLLATLQIEKRTGGFGKLYRDPLSMSFLQYDNSFLKSLTHAWQYVRSEGFKVEACDVRWRLRGWEGTGNRRAVPEYIRGGSIGAGCSLALLNLFGSKVPRPKLRGNGVVAVLLYTLGAKPAIDPLWAITGNVTADGKIESVSGYPAKLQAVSERKLKAIVPSGDFPKLAETWAHRIDRLEGASTVADASRIAAGRIESEEQIKRAVARGLSIFLVLLTTAGIIAAYQWIRAEKRGRDLASANVELQKREEQLKVANVDLQKRGEELRTANNELERAKNAAEDQRDVATEQRHVAEIARNNEQVQRMKAEEQRKIAEVARTAEEEQRKKAEQLEVVAMAQRQLAIARQAELQADRAMAENDPASAQLLYAKALSLDERLDTRGRYLQSRARPFMKFSWSNSVSYASSPLRLSPDGQTVAIGKADSSIVLLNATTGELLRSFFNVNANRIQDVAFSENNDFLATASTNGLVTIWEYKSGRQMRELWFRDCNKKIAAAPTPTPANNDEDTEAEESECRGNVLIAFNPDGTQLAVANSVDPQIKILDIQSGKVSVPFLYPGFYLTNLSFTNDNKIIAAGLSGDVWIMPIGSNKVYQLNHNGKVLSTALSKDRFVTAGDNSIRIWDLTSHKQLNGPLRHNSVSHVYFTSEGRFVLSAADDGTIKVWETESAKEVLNFNSGLQTIDSLAVEKDRLVVRSKEGTHKAIKSWSLTSGAAAVDIGSNEGVTAAVVFSPDATKIASLVANETNPTVGTIKIWDTATRLQVNRIPIEVGPTVRMALQNERGDVYLPPLSIQFAGNDHIVLGGVGPNPPTFDARTGQLIAPFLFLNKDNGYVFTTIASSPDGQSLAASDGAGKIHVFDVRSRRELFLLKGHQDLVPGLKFSPNGASLVSCSFDSTVRVWDIKSGKTTNIFRNNGFPFLSVNYSADGNFIAATSMDQKVRIWDLSSGKEILNHETFDPQAVSISFSPNGRWLAWGSFSSSAIHLLDIAKREEIPPLNGSRGVVMQVSFSPDGKWLAVAGADSEIRLWSMAEVDDVFDSNPLALFNKAEGNTRLTIDLNNANSFSGSTPTFSRSQLYSAVGLYTESTFSVISKDEQRRSATGMCTPVPIIATLNPFPVTFVNPAPACHNFPFLDAKIVGGSEYSGNQVVRDLGTTAKPGDLIRVRVYVDNGAANNMPDEQAVARNVMVNTSLDSTPGLEHAITAFVVSDNTNTLSNSFIVHTDSESILEVVPNSGQVRDWQNVLIKDRVQIGRNAFKIGDLTPGFETDLFLYFDVAVRAPKETSSRADAKLRRPAENEASSVTRIRNKGGTMNCVNSPNVATLNPFPISFSGKACTNFPPLDLGMGDKYSSNEIEWNSLRMAKVGDEVSVLVYIDNGAANSLPLAQTVAKNVKARILVDTSVGSEHAISVSFAGDNTNTVAKSLTVKTAANEFLEIVPDSGAVFDAYNHLIRKLPLGNRVTSLGPIAPGFETDLFLRFTVRVRSLNERDALRRSYEEDSRVAPTFNKVNNDCPNVPYKATLNPFPLTFTDPPERCRNYPPLDLHIGGYSRNESELNSERHANLGDEFYALIYIDNGAADNGPLSQTLAKNIQVKTVVDSGPGTRHTVSVSFAGDNTNTVSKSLIVRTPSNSILEVVPNSGQVLNFQNVLLKTNVEIGNNTFSVGDIGPGFDKDLFLRFKIRIKSIDNANTPDQEQSRVSPYLNKGLGRNCPNPPVKATLNPFPTTYVSPAEFCKNYPAVDVRFATESGRYSQNEEDWKDGIKVKVGDELYVLVYIDNGAANSLPLSETLARNVKVTTIIDTTTGSKHLVSVSFAGENTNTVSASFPIYSQQDSLLEIIPNSGEIRDFLATTILKDKLQIGNNTIDVGDIAPGFQTDLFIRFKVRVVRKYH